MTPLAPRDVAADKAGRVLQGFVILCVLTQLVLFSYFAYRTAILRPFSDMFDLANLYFLYLGDGRFLDYLLEPHNYHRLIWFRALIAADIILLKGSGVPLILAGVLCLAAAAVLLARETCSAADAALKLPAAGLTLMLVASTANAAGVSVPANTPHVHTLLFAVLAVVLAAPRSGRRSSLTARRFAALGCAAAAAFSLAVGLVLWPTLAFMAWRGGKADRPWLVVVGLVGAGFTMAYLQGQVAPGGEGALSAAAVSKLIEYFLAYLGLPWVRASDIAGRLIGCVLFASALLAVLRAGRPGSGRAEQVALGLILFSLGAALLAALGRRDLTPDVDVPVRYAILLAPLHIGLLILALPWLGRQWRARRPVMEAALAACLLALIVQQVLIGQVAARASARVQATITQFERGERTPDMLQFIHPNLRHAEAVSSEMRRRGVYQRWRRHPQE